MKTRRMRERVRGTLADSPPEWLPNGWTVAVRNTRHGEYRCYRSPVSGCTFQSKEEVLRHLSVVKHDNGTSRRASCSNKSQNQSPASAKKLKSQPTGKNHGELSETAIVPDRLLLATLSQENIEVKPDEENPQVSATLSPPCTLNPRERSPKNGRISQSKCTRKSNISNGKTNVGREENIKLEEVTEKPSDRTVTDGKELAKQTEDEANQGRGSKPESATNSKENSKEEDMAMNQIENITAKFPLASNETSKDQLGVANQTESAEKGHFSDPQNKNLSELEKELPVVGNPSTPDLVKPEHGSRKTKDAMNAISRPQPRWLAFVEANLARDVDMGGELPHESKSKNTITEPHHMQASIEGQAAEAMERLRRKNPIDEEASMMNRATMDWPDFPSTLPLRVSWFDDPCLEFAFKTLTGDLPVLDDAIAIQEYFQQQLVSGSTSPDVLGPASKSKAGGAIASNEVEIKLPCEQDMQEMCQLGVMEKK